MPISRGGPFQESARSEAEGRACERALDWELSRRQDAGAREGPPG